MGADFAASVRAAIDGCQAMLVLIGPRWLDSRGADGEQRIAHPQDLVRREIEQALERAAVTIIPVLVEQASMPESAELPPTIAALTARNASVLSDARWERGHRVGDLDAALVGVLVELGVDLQAVVAAISETTAWREISGWPRQLRAM